MTQTTPIALSGTAGASLRCVDPAGVTDWNALVLTHPGSTIFHSREWAEVLKRTYHYRALYLQHSDASRLWGLLPIFEVDSWITGRRGVSLPFTDHCPPLGSNRVSPKELFSAGLELGRSRNWRSLELRGEAEHLPRESASTVCYEHSIDLTVGEEQLLERMDDSARRALRKGERSELKVEIASSRGAVQEYYQIHCLTRRKHGLPPQPWKFFVHLYEQVIANGNGFVCLARWQKRAVAGAIFLTFGRTAVYKFGGSDPAFEHLRSNNLVMWSSIRNLIAAGIDVLSLGRTAPSNEGLRRYKRQLGASESLVPYYQFDFQKKNFVQQTDRVVGFHNKIFRRAPQWLSRAAGELLYKHIG